MYNDLLRSTNKTIKRKKREYMDEIPQYVSDNFAANNTRIIYKMMKNIKEGFKPRTSLCKDKNGNIISGTDKVKTRWMHYF